MNSMACQTDNHRRIDLLGVNISEVTIPRAVDIIDGWIQSRTRTYVCISPVSTLVDCQKDERYREVVNNAGMVTPDGMPVVWMGKAAGSRIIQRTYGPDLMHAVCHEGQTKGYRHFFYGGTPETLNRLEAKLKLKYPAIMIAGKYSPQFFANAQIEDSEIIDKINSARADILWVGLGSPKQDFWMQMHRPLLNVPVMIAVGAAFDFLSGVKPQAPLWMRHSGLEWFFRFCSEPHRLWRRYLLGNLQFLFYLGREWVSSLIKMLSKKSPAREK